jgi:hypothetical protein
MSSKQTQGLLGFYPSVSQPSKVGYTPKADVPGQPGRTTSTRAMCHQRASEIGFSARLLLREILLLAQLLSGGITVLLAPEGYSQEKPTLYYVQNSSM